MNYISIDGQITEYESARIAPGDAGFLHGAGLFETMHARNGKVFRLADHLQRVTTSAEALSIQLSLSLSDLTDMVADLLAANGFDESAARVRLTITRGDLHAITAEDPTPPLTLVLSAGAFTPYPAELYQKGLTAVVSTYKQNPESPLTGHKTTSYLDRLLALREAQALHAGEALWFTPENYLAEGSISNVFMVDKDGVLATPPLLVQVGKEARTRKLCLPGVTRKLVLELATEMNVLPHERLLTIDDLLAAREVFLTNAVMGLMPVTRIEKHDVHDAQPGEMTRKLMRAYMERLNQEC